MPEKIYPEIAAEEKARRNRREDDPDISQFRTRWHERGPDVPPSREERRRKAAEE